jgi:Fe-S cluster assembly protein SufD
MSEPGWLQDLRSEAGGHFSSLGLPTASLEDWRYTARALRPLQDLALRTAPEDAPPAAPPAVTPLTPESEQSLFIDGRYASSETTGRAVQPIAALLAAEDGERLRPHLGALAPIKEDAFAALNTEQFRDGGFIHLAKDERLDRPLEIVFVTTARSASACFPRLNIRAERGSAATVLVAFRSEDGASGLTNALLEIDLAEDAALELIVIQDEDDATLHVSRTYVRQAAQSRLRATTTTLGGRVVRNDLDVELAGPGAETDLDGLFLGTNTQHIDNHTLVDHAAPHCTSRERYKGILQDRSRGVFRGRVVVRPDAQQTSAEQSNPNLLVGDGAEINSKPQLEIHADDVRCSHGSTTGQLDENALFYLRARGIDAVEGRRMLMEAFAAEVTDAVPLEGARDFLRAALAQRLLGTGEPHE